MLKVCLKKFLHLYEAWEVHVSGGPEKVAQLLKGHNSTKFHENLMKLYTTFFQHVHNPIVSFKNQLTINVEISVVLKL